MFAKILTLYLILKIVLAQLDGNFWWMNKELNKYRIEPSPPQFEELSEFDTDESAKIVFRDNDYAFSFSDLVIPRPEKSSKEEKALENDNLKLDIQFQDKSTISWPDDVKQDNYLLQEDKKNKIKEQNNNKTTKTITEDVLDFIYFPDVNEFWRNTDGKKSTRTPTTTTEKSVKKNNINTTFFIQDKIPLQIHEQNSETEHICTLMKKVECNRRGGVIYAKDDRECKKTSFETQTICCILPLPNMSETTKTHKIHFPEISTPIKRIKRSELESPAMNQRNALLLRKYGPIRQQAQLNKATTVKGNHRIVTTEEEYDPYWNIKNSNFKTPLPKPSRQSTPKYDYNFEDYVEDYVVELPQPGLTGLYSDNSARPPNWSFVGETPSSPYGGIVSSEEDGGTSFIYSATVDPRLEDRLQSRPPIRGRPVTLSIASNEKSYNAESQTISYQSNPDFHVLQGYKLLNLVRNKSKIHRNEKKTTTTESVYSDDSKESVLIGSSLETEYDDFDKNQQSFKDCGRPFKESTDYDDDSNKQIGEAGRTSHPWLAMIVLSRKRQGILCYATIVTPRVAVTAADCVHEKTSPGEITLTAGVWDLGDTTRKGWQKRLVTIHLHPQYIPGDLANNLALLHWKRPLTLSESVQPACLSDPHVGDDCKFFGWGGYDQAIRPRSRWQRASILMPRACKEKITTSKRADLPSDAFCASVHSRGTVTGIGGPLICKLSNRHSAVGVAVWRDNAVVLIPAQEWIVRTLSALNLQ